MLRAYPWQSAEFLAGERDPFRNPLGGTLRHALHTLLEEVLAGMSSRRVDDALDSIMQIRAVQGCAPSRALEFLFQLKEILRVDCPPAELGLLHARIDELALKAFDLFMKYRERTYEARANEARRRVFVLERRMMPREQSEWQERNHAP
jgi:hypothetical protein